MEGDVRGEHNASLKCLYETNLPLVSIVILMTTNLFSLPSFAYSLFDSFAHSASIKLF